MNRVYKFLVTVLSLSLLWIPALPAQAYPAAYFKSRQLKIPYNDCLMLAKFALQNAGLSNITSGNDHSSGTTKESRAAIVCVRLPGVGPCKKDGATAIFFAAGDTSYDLVSKIDTKFGNPTLYDCN
jgi:hypothetical protein